MYPGSVAAVVIFLLIVTPGAAFELLWHRTRPRRDESAFIEVSRVLLTGVVFSGAAVVTLTLVQAIAPGAAADPVALLRDGAGYVRAQPAVVLRSVLAVPLLGLLYGVAAHALLSRAASRRVAHETGWHTAFSRLAGATSRAFLSVQLKDGTTVTGFVVGYSTDADPAKRDLLLRRPISLRPPGKAVATQLERSWQILTVPGSEISTIAVAYVGSAPLGAEVGVAGQLLAWVTARAWQTSLVAALGVVIVLIVLASW
ncbi:DUF6338 family protein [Nonomuraea sp. NPDC049400]|uniref:DUF6338 family protein n=1 Tax=Nonomuraea sp. NPDC049400 TaxID=3364352 RepID=UPI0037873E3D